jgi:hypothetical protein
MSNKKYLKSGREVELIETLANGFLINYMMVDGDTGEEWPDEEIIFVEQVFDSPPLEKYSGELLKLRSAISELQNEKTAVQSQIDEARKSEESLLKRHTSLQRLYDFLDGKLTHYVIINYAGIEICTVKEAVCNYDRKSLKLLTLFGSSGNLSWNLNDYSDGSGGHIECVPCISYEDALEKAQAILINKTVSEGCPSKYLIASAEKYGLILPNGYKEKFSDIESKRIEKDIAEYKTKITLLQKQLKEHS